MVRCYTAVMVNSSFDLVVCPVHLYYINSSILSFPHLLVQGGTRICYASVWCDQVQWLLPDALAPKLLPLYPGHFLRGNGFTMLQVASVQRWDQCQLVLSQFYGTFAIPSTSAGVLQQYWATIWLDPKSLYLCISFQLCNGFSGTCAITFASTSLRRERGEAKGKGDRICGACHRHWIHSICIILTPSCLLLTNFCPSNQTVLYGASHQTADDSSP